MMNDEPLVVYTIGHTNHTSETFIQLLQRFQIEVLVDIRSHPYSRFAPQFDARTLKKAVLHAGIQLLFLGKELGGRPEGNEYYDEKGYVLYSRLSAAPPFLEGLTRLQTGLVKFRIALLCSEEDPTGCHRRLLVGQALRDRGIEIRHIRGNGRVQSEDELEGTTVQASMFRDLEVPRRSVVSLTRHSRGSSARAR